MSIQENKKALQNLTQALEFPESSKKKTFRVENNDVNCE